MTKGQLDEKISEAIIKFEKEFMRRGPTGTNTFIIKDMILVRLKDTTSVRSVHVNNKYCI